MPAVRARPRPGARELQGRHAGLQPRSDRDPPPADRPRPLRVHLRPRPGLVPDPGVLLPGLRDPRSRPSTCRPGIRRPTTCRSTSTRSRRSGPRARPARSSRSAGTSPPNRCALTERGACRETDLRGHRRHVHRLLRGLGRPLHPGQGPDHAPQPVPGLQRGAGSCLHHPEPATGPRAAGGRLGSLRHHPGHERADRAPGPAGRPHRDRRVRGDDPAVARPRLRGGPGRAGQERHVQRHPARPAGPADPDPLGRRARRLLRHGPDGARPGRHPAGAARTHRRRRRGASGLPHQRDREPGARAAGTGGIPGRVPGAPAGRHPDAAQPPAVRAQGRVRARHLGHRGRGYLHATMYHALSDLEQNLREHGYPRPRS